MSEVVTGILKFAIGFISNKVRTYGAEKLEDGGLTDQNFRGFMVRELDDIKFKLDANARKDLSASIDFLPRGIQDLQMCIDQFVGSGVPSTSELPEDGKQSRDITNAGASSTETKPAQRSVAIKDALALANAIGKLNIVSSERLESARKSFEEAGKEATLAFNNAALSTEERILASKVRIASGILEHLHDLEFAASRCLHYLQKLHDIPSIQDIFSVHVKGGLKSIFKKDSRLEIVETVTMINLILADFISKFTKRRMAVFDWPMIECGTSVVHPIHYKKKSLPNLKEMEITPPWDIVGCRKDMSALNSERYLICICDYKDSHEVEALVVDEDDIVYVLSGNLDVGHTLSVYSARGRNTHQCTLRFLQRRVISYAITVTKEKNLVICYNNAYNVGVYLCDINGKLITRFDAEYAGSVFHGVFVSCDNEILIAAKHGGGTDCTLHTYSQQGQLQRIVKLPLGFSFSYGRFSYNSATKNIIGVRGHGDKALIEYISDQAGELQRSYLLHQTNFPEDIHSFKLIGHTNGALAFVGCNLVIFLRKPSQ